jgi:RND family efflux transporter MFP subunit
MAGSVAVRVARAALVLAAGMAPVGCGRGATPAAGAGGGAPAIPVTLAPVLDTTIAQPIVASGVLSAKEEIPLAFKIGGVVAQVLVDVGESVEAGQLLAVLEQPEIGAEVARAEAGLTQAERDLARAEALYRDSVIARDRYEAAGTGAELARAALRIARFNQQYAAIRAPAAGTVLRRAAEPGQQIGSGTVVLVLATRTRGQVVRVGLADRDFARVRVGDRASVHFDAGTTTALPARVTRLAAAAAPGTGAWEVEVLLDGPGPLHGAGSGLIGRVEIRPSRSAPGRVVPIAALVEGDGDSAVVYSVVEGKARRHVVRVAFLDGERAAIASGLDGVTRVVTAGAGYLADGVAVAP